MKREPPETFTSRSMSVERKGRFNSLSEWFGCLSAAVVDVVLIPVFLLVLSIIALFSLKNVWMKRRVSSAEKFIFDTADVYQEALVLYTNFPNRKVKRLITLKYLKEILIRDVCLDQDRGNENVRVFEFHHEWGQKPLLRYDIERRDVFIDMLSQKGIPFIET